MLIKYVKCVTSLEVESRDKIVSGIASKPEVTEFDFR